MTGPAWAAVAGLAGLAWAGGLAATPSEAPAGGAMRLVEAGVNRGTDPDFGDYELAVEAFWIDVHPVTQALWTEVRDWAVEQGYEFDHPGYGKAPDHPVQSINWFDALKWCNARSEKEGRLPAFHVSESRSAESVYRVGRLVPEPAWIDREHGYRLPTGVEWEYAARGGRSGLRYPNGNTLTHADATCRVGPDPLAFVTEAMKLAFHPVYDDGRFPFTAPVGSFPPNGFGLHDMVGNVWEWTLDAPPPPHRARRLVRGGSWYSRPDECRLGAFIAPPADFRSLHIGLRTLRPATCRIPASGGAPR